MKESKIAQFSSYLKDVKIEAKKITWPSRKDTLATTYAVIVLVFIVGVYLGFVDIGLSKLIENILK